MLKIPTSGPLHKLIDRAGGRVELLVCYSVARGYELVDWNLAASGLFDLAPSEVGHAALMWEELPRVLAEYLSPAMELTSGAPEESMPEFKHPDRPGRSYFTKVFYQGIPAEGERDEEHWYLFCFQDSVNWLDSSEEVVNQKKLETIGELASGVAHDFNNLIMGIQSNAEAMMTQPGGMAAQARESLVNIIRACSTGASLTRSLLGYAKKQPLTITSFNLIDLIHDVARIAGIASGVHRIVIAKEFQERSEPIIVIGSYSSLSHCLLNLIKNAREAMPDGGTIHVLWEGDAKAAKITVRDHGTGIAEHDMAHIFEPFFSTKKQGTGLGLAMVRGILNQHSGTVEIQSTVGMGTAVSLVWPRGDLAAATGPRKKGVDSRRSTNHIFKHSQRIITQSQRLPAEAHFLIYVIDDDELVREGLSSLLEHLGHRTQIFGNPEEALKTLLAANPPPEIVIVDYNMPEMNGLQFIERYNLAVADDARHAGTQVVLMSGLPPSHFQEIMGENESLRFGILEKPFSLETLRRKLLEIQGKRPSGGVSPVFPKIAEGVPVPHAVPRPNSGHLTRPAS